VALHRALHVEAELAGRALALGVAEAVEAGDRLLAGGGRERLVRLARLDRLGGAVRLAPWTETQAASPIAIRPGQTASGLSLVGRIASPW
jgi:hypothetical protein